MTCPLFPRGYWHSPKAFPASKPSLKSQMDLLGQLYHKLKGRRLGSSVGLNAENVHWALP
jgi:hypothetical protein